MRVAAHQTNFLPWVGYWNKLASVDVLLDMDHAQYVKGEFYNRVKIGGSWATVPVTNTSGPIKDVLIDHHRRPLVKLAERIEQTYAKAPFVDRLWWLIEYLTEKEPQTLVELNRVLRYEVCRIIGIKTKIQVALPGEGATTEERLWDMIKKSCPDASVYHSGAGGQAYMSSYPMPTRFQVVTQDYGGGSVLQLIAQEPDPLKAIINCATWREA